MQKKETQQEKKKCPQQTQIDYPEASQKPKPETHMIDIVPRRKKEEVIRKEIEDYYRKVDVPKNRGVDRKKMINDLQEKFKELRGALPKGAELPIVEWNEDDEENLKKLWMMKKVQREKQ